MRPKILVGNRLGQPFPNFQTRPLMELADVVCVTSNPKEPFQRVLDQLPKGFVPDFYWDYQAEHLRPIHPGLEDAPFPTVAGVCHTYCTLAIEAVYSLYDRILPVNPVFGNLMAKKFPGKNIDIPFGLNWASFGHMFKPRFIEKKWDVCLTFSPTVDTPHGDRRAKIVAKMEEFKRKYGSRYKVCINYMLPQAEYMGLLRDSRIAVNVVGVNGPYNYRTLESMALGAMVFQYDWSDGFFTNTFDGLFKDGEHGVSFTEETFEEKLLYYLDHPEKTAQIARQAWLFSEENFSHEKLFTKLINEMKKVQAPSKRTVINPASRIYLYQCDAEVLPFLTPGNVDVPWIQANNALVVNRKEEYYREALKGVPESHRWIVEWNYHQKFLEHEPIPFDEERILIKPLIQNKQDFFHMNLEILKAIDNPVKRAHIYREWTIRNSSTA